MGWNGSGVFNRIYSWVQDATNGLNINATRMDTDTDDIATNGFGNCLTRDGQGKATAQIPFPYGATFGSSGQFAIDSNGVFSFGSGPDFIPGNTISSSSTANLLVLFGSTFTLPDGAIAVTAGRTTEGDGGGAAFYYKSSDTTTADNGGTVRVDGQGRRWFAIISGACNVELFGVFGGDSSFDSGHATSNKTALDNAIANGPYNLLFLTPGLYCTTGHIITGSQPHRLIGLGQSTTNAIMGSGIAYAYAADTSATDPISGKNFVFQNGVQGNALHTQFSNLSIRVSNTSTVCPVIVGTALSVSTNWDIGADYCYFEGYSGWHWQWANGNVMTGNRYTGVKYAQSRVIPNISASQGSNIQKIVETSPILSCTTQSGGSTLYFENDPGSKQTITDNVFLGGAYEYAVNGFVIDGFSTWITPHIERVSGTQLSGDTASISTTYWLFPGFAGGNSGAAHLAALGPRSTMVWNGNHYNPTAGGYFRTSQFDTNYYTVATLPAAPNKSERAFVTDGSVVAAGNFGTIVAGGGGNQVPVFFDGTNWRIG